MLRPLPVCLFVLARCAGLASAQTFVMDDMPVTTCAGVFTDSGGTGAPYSSNEAFSKTFTPGMTGSKLSFTFTTWDVERGGGCPFDSLTVYDGANNTAPLIGTFCGTTSPGTIVATGAGGELTFEWISDAVVTDTGWEADIACTTGSSDDCSEALTVALGQTSSSLLGTAPDGATTCDAAGGSDRWFEFTAAANGTLRLDVNGALDSVLSVHSSCPGTGANELACNDDYNGGSTSQLSWPMLAGELVLIRVAEKANPASLASFVLDVDFVVGDACADALDASAGGSYEVDYAGTPADGSSSCDCPSSMAGNSGTDAWLTHTAAFAGVLRVELLDSVEASLSLHTGCPGVVANEVDCDGGFTTLALTAERAVLAGQTTLIRIAARCDPLELTSALVSVTLDPPPPTNDDCANAVVLSAGYQTVDWDNTGATTDGSSAAGFCDYGPSGGALNHNDVWYRWTAPDTGCVYISHLGLAGVDTRLTVYDSTQCPDDPAAIVSCSDDEVLPIMSPFEAGLDLDVSAGSEYLIRTGTFSAATPTGSYQMVIAQGAQAFMNNSTGMVPPGGGCIVDLVYANACFGDGGDQQGCTACPCSNEAPAGSTTGCLNSAGTGARIAGSGSSSVMATGSDDLFFSMEGAVPGSFGVLTSGAALAPQNMANPCFGLETGVQSNVLDGLRCVVSNVQRHGGRAVAADGTTGVSTPGWGGANGPPSGLAGQGGFVAGQLRHFQAFYRDLPLTVCGTEQNTTQAVGVTFEP